MLEALHTSRFLCTLCLWGSFLFGVPAPIFAGYSPSPADSVILIDVNALVEADSSEGDTHVKVATVSIEHPGHYRIWTKVWYNSGDAQQNESFYLLVKSPSGNLEYPVDSNAGPYKVVPDAPGPAHIRWKDAGLFYFHAGENEIHMYHYALIASQYPQFKNGPMGNAESVYLDSLKLIHEPIIDGSVTLTGSGFARYSSTDSLPVVYPGETYSLSALVRNLERDILAGASLTLRLPRGFSALNFSLSPTSADSAAYRWQLPDIAAFDSLSIEMQIAVPPSLAPGTALLAHSVLLNAPTDRNPANNADTLWIYSHADSLGQRPTFADVSVDILLDEQQQTADGAIGLEYRIIVQNAGPDTALSLTLMNRIPENLTTRAFNVEPTQPAPDSLVWTFDALPPGQTITVTYQAIVPVCPPPESQVLINQVQIIAANDTLFSNNQDADTTTIVIPPADLGVFAVVRGDSQIVVEGTPYPAVETGSEFEIETRLYNATESPSCSVAVRLSLSYPLKVQAFAPPPTTAGANEFMWSVQFLAPYDTVRFRVIAAADSIPYSPFPVWVHFYVLAAPDANPANDSASALIYIVQKKTGPPAQRFTDVSIALKAMTDTTAAVQDKLYPAVRPGDVFTYRIRVQNHGDWTADSLLVQHILPPYVEGVGFQPDPFIAKDDTLFWRLQNLEPDGQAELKAQLVLSEGIPDTLNFLVSEARVFSQQDTLFQNNTAVDSVFILQPVGIFVPDLAILQIIRTDSFKVQNADTIWYAQAEDTVAITLLIANRGTGDAEEVRLTNYLPESFALLAASPEPAEVTDDSLVWRQSELGAGESYSVRFLAQVPALEFPGTYRFYNTAMVAASNEPPHLWFNNQSTDSITVEVIYMLPPPLIEAVPERVSVGDSVVVRVQVPVEVSWWDIFVYYANGEIDSSYADEFIARTPIQPLQWYELEPPFTDTRLTTEAREEAIIFEIQIQDRLGFRESARAAVLVRSANALALDRNVFNPESDGEMAIRFKLSSRRLARLDLFDLSGAHITKITEGIYEPDWNTYMWNGLTEEGRPVGSGVYIVLLRSGEFQSWKKVIIVR